MDVRQRHRPPAELTGFVGRRRQLGEIHRLLSGSRLLTLTGPGGIGKTRLALRAANQLAERFANGVRVIQVSEVPNRHLLTQAVFAAVGLDGRTRRWRESVLTDFLRDKYMLLVFDECEHMLDACAQLLSTLLRNCPGVQVIATSRQPIGIEGEVRLRVPPLSVPDPGQVGSPGEALTFDAVKLFAERAAAAEPGFVINRSNYEAVAALCRRLDGIPLALELMAVRLDAYSVDQLIEGLDDQLALLESGVRGRNERHRTVRATIDWSFQLLSDEEKAVWTRLAILSGDFGITAATFLCRGGEFGGSDVQRIIGSLVDKSMVMRHGTERYRLLEPMRQFAAEQLSFRAEEPELKLRLVKWIADVAREASSPSHQSDNFRRLHLERASLWSALDICQRQPEYAELGLTIFFDLSLYFRNRGSLPNAREAVETLLQVTAPNTLTYAKGLYAAGEFAFLLRDIAAAKRHLTESIRVARLLGNPEVVGWCLFYLSAVAWEEGEHATETDYAEQMLQLSRAMGNDFQHSVALLRLGLMRVEGGEVAGGLQLLDEALGISGNLHEEYFRSLQLWNVAIGHMRLGQLELAETAGREALDLAVALGAGHSLALCTECLAWIAAERCDAVKAARILGAAREMWKSIGTPLFRQLDAYHDRCETYARTVLGDVRFAAELHTGEMLSEPDLVQLAISDSPGKLDASVRPWMPAIANPEALTAREMEVARMVTAGLSSKEIGAELRIAARTVDAHVGHILAKLGLNSRIQLVHWLASRHALETSTSASAGGPPRGSASTYARD
jgi:non-specific serine/threonine protein kinase